MVVHEMAACAQSNSKMPQEQELVRVPFSTGLVSAKERLDHRILGHFGLLCATLVIS